MSTMQRLGLSLLTALLTTTLFLGCTSSPTTQSYGPNAPKKRVALVIGNAEYKPQPNFQGQIILGNVPSASKDAKDMTTALQESGFTVYQVLDGDRETMRTTLRRFGEQLDKNTVGFFYFSGHGLEVDDETYLISTDANPLNSSLDKKTLAAKAVTRSEVYAMMADTHLNFVVLDACRDSGSATDDTDKGVVAMLKGVDQELKIEVGANPGKPEQMPERTILVYATGDGHSATGSSSAQQNSLYTKHLLKFITEPGLSINKLFDDVSRSVEQETEDNYQLKSQIPKKAQSETSGVENSFLFRQGSANGTIRY